MRSDARSLRTIANIYILDIYIPSTRPLEYKQKQMARRIIAVVLHVWLNVLFSVLIILLNKWIYIYHGFPNVTLTCLHLLVTSVCLTVCEQCGVFHRKSLPVTDVFRLSLTFCAYVVFANLSLQWNAVGTYLVFKMATLPAVVAVEAFWCCRKFSKDILLTLVSRFVFYL